MSSTRETGGVQSTHVEGVWARPVWAHNSYCCVVPAGRFQKSDSPNMRAQVAGGEKYRYYRNFTPRRCQ
eukprot:981147-Prorocentrum_minimum.AAC.1